MKYAELVFNARTRAEGEAQLRRLGHSEFEFRRTFHNLAGGVRQVFAVPVRATSDTLLGEIAGRQEMDAQDAFAEMIRDGDTSESDFQE